MLRILRIGASVPLLESLALGPALLTNNCASGRLYSTCGPSGSGMVVQSGGLISSGKGLLSGAVTAALTSEQCRSYWRKEGRIGYRRMKRKEMQHREQILNPSSPVIDQRVPWPKDDFETLPQDLFGEEIDEKSPEEIRSSQNAIVSCINNQISSHTEGRLFAVVHINGKQFKVTPEDIIVIQNSFFPTIGDQIRLHKVLLVGGKDFTLIGRPILDLDFVRIEATVIEKTLSYTKLNFKMIKRSNYKRLKFMKTHYTMLRINLIELMQPLSMITSDVESVSQEQQTSTV